MERFTGFEMTLASQVVDPREPGIHVLLHLLRGHLRGISAAPKNVEEGVGLFFHDCLPF